MPQLEVLRPRPDLKEAPASFFFPRPARPRRLPVPNTPPWPRMRFAIRAAGCRSKC